MKKIKLGKHALTIYDSIEELPIVRFHKYNKMVLVDSGIGSSISDIDTHISKALAYIRTKDTDSAFTELMNLRQCVYFTLENVQPRHLSYVTLIAEVDGEPCTDISDAGLSQTLLKIHDISFNALADEFAEVKKKIDAELRNAFPSTFESATEKEYYDLLRQRTLLQLQEIQTGETAELKRKIQEVSDKILTFAKPKNFQGAENAEVKHDKEFEQMCILIAQKIHTDAKKYNVFEFYNAFEYIKEQQKALQSQK